MDFHSIGVSTLLRKRGGQVLSTPKGCTVGVFRTGVVCGRVVRIGSTRGDQCGAGF